MRTIILIIVCILSVAFGFCISWFAGKKEQRSPSSSLARLRRANGGKGNGN